MRKLSAGLVALALLSAPAAADFNGNELQAFKNISSSTATFTLRGGAYGVTVHASSYGTVTLQRQATDGSTMVTALAAFSADGYASVNLPPGTYQFTISGASGVYVDITSIVTVQ